MEINLTYRNFQTNTFKGLWNDQNLADDTLVNLDDKQVIPHEGTKFDCNQGDNRATIEGHLTTHKKSKHEGMKYDCNHCDYRATMQSNLYTDTKSQHLGVMYDCKKCDFRTNMPSSLTIHKSQNMKE